MSEYSDMVNDVVSHLTRANVEIIFGESREFEGKIIIPVGKVRYGWGGGSGKGPSGKQGEGAPEGEGSGMGMGVMVKPMGFITVSADSVQYQPIVDYGPLMWVLGPVLGLAMLKLVKAMMIGKMPGSMHKYPMHKWGMHGGGRRMCGRQMMHPFMMKAPFMKHHKGSHAKPHFMHR